MIGGTILAVAAGAVVVGLGFNVARDRFVYFDVVAIKRLGGIAIELHARLGIVCHGADQGGFRLGKITLILQHSQIGRRTQIIFFLFGVQGLSSKIARLL